MDHIKIYKSFQINLILYLNLIKTKKNIKRIAIKSNCVFEV